MEKLIYRAEYNEEDLRDVIKSYIDAHKKVRIRLYDFVTDERLMCNENMQFPNHLNKISRYKPIRHGYIKYFIKISRYTFYMVTRDNGICIEPEKKYHYGDDINRNLSIMILYKHFNEITKYCRIWTVMINGI